MSENILARRYKTMIGDKKGVEQMRLTAAITKEENWYVAKCLEVEVKSRSLH